MVMRGGSVAIRDRSYSIIATLEETLKERSGESETKSNSPRSTSLPTLCSNREPLVALAWGEMIEKVVHLRIYYADFSPLFLFFPLNGSVVWEQWISFSWRKAQLTMVAFSLRVNSLRTTKENVYENMQWGKMKKKTFHISNRYQKYSPAFSILHSTKEYLVFTTTQCWQGMKLVTLVLSC